MNINDAFPSNYLRAADIGTGQPIVTISHVKVEAIGKSKDLKPVLYFKGKQKGLVLNKTNSKKIAELCGTPDTDEWVDMQIKLYTTETEFSGETVECVRIKAAKKAAEPPPPPPPARPEPETSDDDIPF